MADALLLRSLCLATTADGKIDPDGVNEMRLGLNRLVAILRAKGDRI